MRQVLRSIFLLLVSLPVIADSTPDYIYTNMENDSLSIGLYRDREAVVMGDTVRPARRCNSMLRACLSFEGLVFALPDSTDPLVIDGSKVVLKKKHETMLFGKAVEVEIVSVEGAEAKQTYWYSPTIGLFAISLELDGQKSVFLLRGNQGFLHEAGSED